MGQVLFRRAVGAIALTTATACVVADFESGLEGSGRVVSQSRPVSHFDRIAVEDDFDVEVTVGPAASLAVSGDDNLLPYVRTEARNGTFHLETDRNLDPTDEIRIRVTTPSLRGISSSGSSDVRATGVRAESFQASVSGASDVIAEGDFGDLDVSISGSGSIQLRGSGDEIDASVSGSGELDLARLAARTAEVRVSGSGDALVHAVESLQASVSGSGDVQYLGEPRVRSSVSGSGSVRPARSNR